MVLIGVQILLLQMSTTTVWIIIWQNSHFGIKVIFWGEDDAGENK